MCHNSALENEQIEKCIENGMPAKIIKTIKHTMRKRATNEEINQKLQQKCLNSNNNSNSTQQINPHNEFVTKCPFGYGKLATPAATFLFSPITLHAMPNSLIDNDLQFSNNNNNNNDNSYEKFSQNLELKTTITTTNATTDNCNAITNSSEKFDDDIEKSLLAINKIYNDDILAKSTQVTRNFAFTIQQAVKKLQSSKTYTLLTHTTQPAHLVAIGIITFVLLTVWPELIDSSNGIGYQTKNQHHYAKSVHSQEISVGKHTLALIAYLGAFSTHFGTQIWMTFVSGLSLYFSLPRHMFGQCQQILFPKYFTVNAVLSITMLILYMKFFINTWTVAKCVQLGSLALTCTIELFVRLYLTAPLLRLMHEKYKIEATIGSGKEVGSLVQGDLIQCPHYQRIHKAFRRIHMIVAIGNIITMAGSCLQLYNIAGQLQISIAS